LVNHSYIKALKIK